MDMEAIRTMMETASAEDRQKSMDEWKGWIQANAASFADGGAPLGKNTQVTAAGSSQLSNDIGGYAIIQAENVEAVAQVLATSPHFKMPGTTCDVMEIVQM